jgi:hypothetical protein
VENLRADLADIEAAHRGPVRVVNGELPLYLTGLDLFFRDQSDLITLLDDPRVYFRPKNRAEYKIDPDGHVARLHPRRARGRR